MNAATAAPDPSQDPQGFLRALYACAVSRALPADVTAAHLPPPPDKATCVQPMPRTAAHSPSARNSCAQNRPNWLT